MSDSLPFTFLQQRPSLSVSVVCRLSFLPKSSLLLCVAGGFAVSLEWVREAVKSFGKSAVVNIWLDANELCTRYQSPDDVQIMALGSRTNLRRW